VANIWRRAAGKKDSAMALRNNVARRAVAVGGTACGFDGFFRGRVCRALTPGPAVRADQNYRAEITGAEDSDLASLLDKVSELKTLEDKPPASEEALRRRADRDLGRAWDAAHSLGYWDAGFLRTSHLGETAKVTVTVKQGRFIMSPRSSAGTRRAAAIDSQDEKEAATQTGRPARTAPVVATETALVTAFGDSGHPLPRWRTAGSRSTAAPDDGRDLHARPGRSCVLAPPRSRGSNGSSCYVEGRVRWQAGEIY